MAIIKREKQHGVRRTTADLLKQAVVGYYAHKTFSCYVELGVVPWGKRRLDVFAMNTKGLFIGVEIKSCVADFKNDDKWQEYLEHVNFFYFCVTEPVYAKLEKEFKHLCKEHGIGVMVLDTKMGYIRVVKSAKRRDVEKRNKLRLLLKVAWRGGESKRTIKRRTRLFLTEAEN